MEIWLVVVIFLAGGSFGLLVGSLMFVARKSDQETEQQYQKLNQTRGQTDELPGQITIFGESWSDIKGRIHQLGEDNIIPKD